MLDVRAAGSDLFGLSCEIRIAFGQLQLRNRENDDRQAGQKRGDPCPPNDRNDEPGQTLTTTKITDQPVDFQHGDPDERVGKTVPAPGGLNDQGATEHPPGPGNRGPIFPAPQGSRQSRQREQDKRRRQLVQMTDLGLGVGSAYQSQGKNTRCPDSSTGCAPEHRRGSDRKQQAAQESPVVQTGDRGVEQQTQRHNQQGLAQQGIHESQGTRNGIENGKVEPERGLGPVARGPLQDAELQHGVDAPEGSDHRAGPVPPDGAQTGRDHQQDSHPGQTAGNFFTHRFAPSDGPPESSP